MNNQKSSFEYPVYFEYCPPASLLYFLTIVHLLASISLFMGKVPVLIQLLLLMILLLSYVHQVIQYRQAKRDTVRFNLSSDNVWQCRLNNTQIETISLLEGSFVHPRLIIMRFKRKNKKTFSVYLTKKNCPPDIHRRLRVRLRINNSG